MTALDYLEEKTYVHYGVSVVSEDDAYEAVDMVKREIAEEIRNMIINYRKHHTKGDIASYIQSYCEGIMDF